MQGQKFGRLVVLSAAGANAQGRLLWNCACLCGKTTAVSGTKLRLGLTQSCGCYRDECASKRAKTHGGSKTPTYASWGAMMHRCYTEKRKCYSEYGGRGITVVKRWHKYENFLADMGERPAGLSLDRINNSKGYGPRNCRWATPQQQAQNTRRTIWISYAGKKQALSAWARELGVAWSTLQWRYNAGWTPQEVINGRR